MNLLIHFLVATALIVGFFALRIFADRRALQETLRKNQTEQKEECVSCALKTTQQNPASTQLS